MPGPKKTAVFTFTLIETNQLPTRLSKTKKIYYSYPITLPIDTTKSTEREKELKKWKDFASNRSKKGSPLNIHYSKKHERLYIDYQTLATLAFTHTDKVKELAGGTIYTVKCINVSLPGVENNKHTIIITQPSKKITKRPSKMKGEQKTSERKAAEASATPLQELQSSNALVLAALNDSTVEIPAIQAPLNTTKTDIWCGVRHRPLGDKPCHTMDTCELLGEIANRL